MISREEYEHISFAGLWCHIIAFSKSQHTCIFYVLIYILGCWDKRYASLVFDPTTSESLIIHHPMAYFCVQLRAVDSYLDLSVLYMWAISGTSGSSGFGSVSNEQIDSKTWFHRAIITNISKTEPAERVF